MGNTKLSFKIREHMRDMLIQFNSRINCISLKIFTIKPKITEGKKI